MPKKPRRHIPDTPAEILAKLGSAALRERVHAVFDPFVTALLDAALGVRHLYVKDPTTQRWTRVTDPATITALLNRPARATEDPVWIIHTQDPDAQLLDGLLAFQLGESRDPDAVPETLRTLVHEAETGDLTASRHGELLERLRQRFARAPRALGAGTPRPRRRLH